MHNLTCLIKGCQARVYAPAGTHSICREYFLGYLTQPGLLMNASAAIASFPARGKWRRLPVGNTALSSRP